MTNSILRFRKCFALRNCHPLGIRTTVTESQNSFWSYVDGEGASRVATVIHLDTSMVCWLQKKKISPNYSPFCISTLCDVTLWPLSSTSWHLFSHLLNLGWFGQKNVTKVMLRLPEILHVSAHSLRTLQLPCEQGQASSLEDERPHGAELSYPSRGHPGP